MQGCRVAARTMDCFLPVSRRSECLSTGKSSAPASLTRASTHTRAPSRSALIFVAASLFQFCAARRLQPDAILSQFCRFAAALGRDMPSSNTTSTRRVLGTQQNALFMTARVLLHFDCKHCFTLLLTCCAGGQLRRWCARRQIPRQGAGGWASVREGGHVEARSAR